MKIVVLSFVMIAFLGCKPNSEKPVNNQNNSLSSKEDKEASLFEYLDGKALELSDFKGKRILINYWATWCVPCIKEMPSLMAAEKLLEEENYVFLLASDESVDKIEDFISKKKFDLSFIKYNGSLSQQNIQALPTTFIYNTKGEKADEIVGAVEWDSSEIIEKLRNVE